MKIDNVYIDGFRSVKNLTFNTKGNLQVLVGKNDVGKSNILRALDLFFNNSIDKVPLNWDKDFNINYLRAKGKNAPSCITISIKFSLSNDTNKPRVYKDFINKLSNSFTIQKEFYLNRTITFYKNDSIEKNITDDDDPLKHVIDKFFAYIHYFYVPINKDENWLKQSYIFTDIKNRFIDAWGKGIGNQRTVSKLKSDIEKILLELKNVVDNGMGEITKDFQNLFSDYSKVTFKTPTTPNELLSLLDIEITSSRNISTTLGQRGSGVQSASIPLLLYYVDSGKSISARNSLYFPIWGIEEPESFQHDELNCSISEFFFNRVSNTIQAFITTHSTHYLNPENSENIHLVTMESSSTQISVMRRDWESYLRSISKELGFFNMHTDLFLILKESHDKALIVFEGIHDINIFKKICSIDISVKSKYKNFVPIDGEGSNLPGKVKLLSNTNHKILVILDNDKDGNSYKNQLASINNTNLTIKQYSNNEKTCILESLIPQEIKTKFIDEVMPQEAKEYWTHKSALNEILNTGYVEEPKGWDKPSFKKKLVDYYTTKFTAKEDFRDFISFYSSI